MLLFSSFPSNYSLLVKRDWFCWCRLNNPIGTLIKEVVKLDRLKSFLRFMRTFFLYGRKPNQADKLCHGVHQGKATWQQPGPYWAAMEVDVLTGPWPLFLETSLCSLRSHPSRAILWFICCTVRKNIREKAGKKKKKRSSVMFTLENDVFLTFLSLPSGCSVLLEDGEAYGWSPT